jgi:hypothetical protein
MPRYYESAIDPSVDEETGILKNLLGCRTEDEISHWIALAPFA